MKVVLGGMLFARRAVLAALAGVVGLSLVSAAGGETRASAGEPPAVRSSSGGTQAGGQQSDPHKKALTKRKKRRKTVPVAAPHPTSRLTLASSADLSGRGGDSSRIGAWSALEGALVDEAGLPAPVARGTCPPEMASIERRYCVDRWEGSLVETGSAGDRPFSPFLIVEGHDVRAASVPGVFPQGYISGSQAQAACERAGKRLCSTNEWRKACVGPKTELYGYAHEREGGRCNDAGRSPMLALWGGAALSEPSGWDPFKMNDPRLNQMDGGLARTGSHPSCTNEYGVFDMVGNLHEWTSDPHGTFQGGYFLDTQLNGEGCSYRTTAHDFDYHDYSTGCRCCKDPI
jgi:hypothetical protein